MVRKKRISKPGVPTSARVKYGRSGVYKEGKQYVYYFRGKKLEAISRKGLSIDAAQERIDRHKTFKKGYEREITPLRNGLEVIMSKKASVDRIGNFKGDIALRPRLRRVQTRGGEDVRLYQYVVFIMDSRGNTIAARSQMAGRAFALTPQQMRDEAWQNFYKRIDAYENGNFIDSEGGEVDSGRTLLLTSGNYAMSTLSEGYVSYR